MLNLKPRYLSHFCTAPDFNQEFVLETNASGSVLTGVLLQDGSPVGVASRRLSGSEVSWTVVELEALAIMKSLSKFWLFSVGMKIQTV